MSHPSAGRTQTTESPSPADVLANRIGALVNGWTIRPVTRDDFHAADDLVMEMYQHDSTRATTAHEKLCQQYEAWLKRQTQPAALVPEPTDVPAPLQPALL